MDLSRSTEMDPLAPGMDGPFDARPPAPAAAVPDAPAKAAGGAGALPDIGLEAFHAFRADREALRELLLDVASIGGDAIARKIDMLCHELDGFAPAVTMIGQIKSGKTTLVNAMAARPGLLPADVNPWTSVVTSLHLGVPRRDALPRAAFRFFDAEEWDRLVKDGGRIGELAGRTGADREAEKLRAQVAAMREKTRARLGRRFELMLGQTHDYARFDADLVKRYVCMADDHVSAPEADGQGQFADITRSAELWIDDPVLPAPLTIRDTPGVNDTFMMREQITIRALQDSRTCVVVLSAHQALSSTDLGLIRLLSNMRARQVVIFVNRIDELSDPAAQIPEIRRSLEDTLARHEVPGMPDIVFGSAYWASAVIEGTLDDMASDSTDALYGYAVARLGAQAAALSPRDLIWTLSGLPELYAAIGARVSEGACDHLLRTARQRGANFLAGLRASSNIVSLRARSGGGDVWSLSPEEVSAILDGIAARLRADLSERLDVVFARFSERVDSVHARFLERALDSLLEHLETHGEGAVWSYAPDGLRVLIRSAYQVMRRNFARACEGTYALAAGELTTAYGRIFDVEAANFLLEVPPAPETPQPVALAQTIALDVKTSWWRSWWGRRRGYRAFADDFRALIATETAPMVDELKVVQAQEIRALAMRDLDAFLDEQRDVLDDMCRKSRISLQELHGLFGVTAQEEREELLDMLFEEFGLDDASSKAAPRPETRPDLRGDRG